MAEIALDFQHQRRRSDFWIPRLPGQDLLGERVHTSRGLADPTAPKMASVYSPPPGLRAI